MHIEQVRTKLLAVASHLFIILPPWFKCLVNYIYMPNTNIHTFAVFSLPHFNSQVQQPHSLKFDKTIPTMLCFTGVNRGMKFRKLDTFNAAIIHDTSRQRRFHKLSFVIHISWGFCGPCGS